MDKPRVIIADKDENYVQSIELKFIEDFFDKIELEIITDHEYFEGVFGAPQSADILIVSEGLYDSSLQKHNIKNIFVMTEQHAGEETFDLNITKIFKYSSIKGIFNEILGQSSNDLKIVNEVKKEPQIIVVTSAAGGVGKTTIALGICTCLSKNYKKVLYINASRLQSFQYMMDNPTPVSEGDIYVQLNNIQKCTYEDIKHIIRKESFSYFPPFKAALMSLGIAFGVYENIATMARDSGEYDFIIMDSDGCFDFELTHMFDTADKVIVVTDQSKKSVYATNALVSNVNGINSEKYIFLCNKYEKEKENALISSEIILKFNVSEYIDYIPNYEIKKVENLGDESGIKKAAFLVI
ncbi:AAA family ATPase [Eubacterium ramulus]